MSKHGDGNRNPSKRFPTKGKYMARALPSFSVVMLGDGRVGVVWRDVIKRSTTQEESDSFILFRDGGAWYAGDEKLKATATVWLVQWPLQVVHDWLRFKEEGDG